MSVFARTAIDEGIGATALGAAFDAQQAARGGLSALSLDQIDRGWLQVLDRRSVNDRALSIHVASIAALLAQPDPATFQTDMASALAAARRHAYPCCQAVKDKKAALSGYSTDHNLNSIDLGLLRQVEDDAALYPNTASLVREALKVLRNSKLKPEVATSQMFDVYGEALLQRLIRCKLPGLITVDKVNAKGSAPDFKCVLSRAATSPPLDRDLTFYIEVKTLDLAGGVRAHEQMRDEALDREIDLERQIRAGKRVATTISAIAPWRRPDDKTYRSDSLRMLIERMINRAENVLSAAQFRLGPTFACLNLVRTQTPGFREAALVPTAFHSDTETCVTGLLYAVAFGRCGWQVHKRPEFEGAATLDGVLEKEGLLVNETLGLNAAGLLVLDHQQRYRLDGLFDSEWTDAADGWSNLETEVVMHLLCDAYNTLDNENGLRLSRG